MNGVEAEVWQTVQALNRSWTQGKGETLSDYFHEEMVAITPTAGERIEGREACVAAWKAFAETATIRSWEESEPKVALFGDTAVVTYYFRIAFELGGESISMRGRDLFTMVYQNGRWLAVADHFSPSPQVQ